MIKRTSRATWTGGLKNGNGDMLVGDKRTKFSHTFSTRFEEAEGSNPEELVGAALAGCFSMALAGNLEKENYKPQSISTVATVIMEKDAKGFDITTINLETSGEIAEIDAEKFQNIAETTKNTCPVAKLFRGAAINVNAKLIKS